MANTLYKPNTAVTKPVLSMYELEDDLAALLDTEEMVSPEQRAEFEQQLAEQLEKTVAKRDRVGEFMSYCEAQAEACKNEAKRLQERAGRFLAAREQMRRYVLMIVERLGSDVKGKPRKLEGQKYTFSSRQNAGTVEITDAALIPEIYRRITLTLDGATITRVIASADAETAGALMKALESATPNVDKRSIKAAIDGGESVPGADITYGTSLVVR